MYLIDNIIVSKKTIKQIKESKLLGLVIIGGAIMLYRKWRANAERLMRKNKINYGDKVKKDVKDPFGRIRILTGELFKHEGIPKVLLDSNSRMGLENIVLWDEEFKKIK